MSGDRLLKYFSAAVFAVVLGCASPRTDGPSADDPGTVGGSTDDTGFNQPGENDSTNNGEPVNEPIDDPTDDPTGDPTNAPQSHSGLVFEKTPDDGSATLQTLKGLPAGAKTLSGEHFSVWTCIDPDGCIEALWGCPSVGPCTEGSVAQVAVADDNGDFLYEMNPEPLEPDPAAEVNVYYHLSQLYDRYLEMGADPLDEPIYVVIGMTDPGLPIAGATSYWDRSGLISAWTGARNVAYDPDVFGHELAHVMFPIADRWLLSTGVSLGAGALAEGTADYFAATVYDDPEIGEYAGAGYDWPYLSSVDNPSVCPDHLFGQDHRDGQIFSGFLWELRDVLGADRVNHALLSFIKNLPDGFQLSDAAKGIIDILPEDQRGIANKLADDRGLNSCDGFVDAGRGFYRYFFIRAAGSDIVYTNAQGEAEETSVSAMPWGIQLRVATDGLDSLVVGSSNGEGDDGEDGEDEDGEDEDGEDEDSEDEDDEGEGEGKENEEGESDDAGVAELHVRFDSPIEYVVEAGELKVTSDLKADISEPTQIQIPEGVQQIFISVVNLSDESIEQEIWIEEP